MASRRRTSPKPTPLDIDGELDEMYSSPITRPSLSFLRVASSGYSAATSESDVSGKEITPPVTETQPSLSPNSPATEHLSSFESSTLASISTTSQFNDATLLKKIARETSLDTSSSDSVSMDVRPPGKWKIHRCSTVQDAHSSNEQLLYELLWRLAKPVNPDERLITISRDDMASQTRITVRNIKGVLDRLIEKLALERLVEPNSFTRVAATYRIYSYRKILDQRRKAGLEWVTRANGVRFISLQLAQEILAKPKFQYNDARQPDEITTLSQGALSSSDSMSYDATSMDVSYENGQNTGILRRNSVSEAAPVELGSGLRKINPAFDSAAVARLWRECRSRIQDCTVEEVLHFAEVKVSQIRSDKNVRNVIGLLLTSVPEFFEHNAVQEFRRTQDQQLRDRAKMREENQRYWEAVLKDPKATPDERTLAAEFCTGLPVRPKQD